MKPTKELIAAAELVLANQANVETIRPIVTAYQREILAANNFEYSEDFEQAGKITEPADTWKMKDEQFTVYDALLTEAAAKAGFILEPGVCPLLRAENELIQAERVLIEAAAKFSNTPALTSIYNLEKRAELIRLTLNYAAPHIKKSAKQILGVN